MEKVLRRFGEPSYAVDTVRTPTVDSFLDPAPFLAAKLGSSSSFFLVPIQAPMILSSAGAKQSEMPVLLMTGYNS